MKPNSKQTNLSLKEKVQVLDDLESNKNVLDVAREWKICTATVYNIRRKADKIRKQSARKRSWKSKRERQRKFETVEKELFKCYKKARISNPTLPISGTWLQERAKKIAEEEGKSGFKASNNWLEGFKNRFKLSTRRSCGEAAKVDQEDIDSWLERNQETLNSYPVKNIFNADETGFFYKMLPNRSVHFKGEACHGGELSKERFTVLLCANFDGTEKLTPLVIGHSKNPRCFPKKSRNDTHHRASMIGCEYRSQKRAWMDSEIFSEWLLKLERTCSSDNRHILLLLDNFKCHEVDLDLPHVKILFLPPNTTSKSQPMDQGIINNVKQLYKKHLAEHYWSETQSGVPKAINLLQGIRFLKQSWDEVKRKTISNCFKKCLPNIQQASLEDEDEAAFCDSVSVNPIIIRECFPETLTFADFVGADQNLVIADQHDSDSEDSGSHRELEPVNNEAGEQGAQEDDDKTVTDKEALQALAVLVNHCSQRPEVMPEISAALSKYRGVILNDYIRNKKQANILTYFSSASV